jgi:hypothetical protein
MNTKTYDRRRANKLMPLLEAIGRELQERSHALEEIERRLKQLAKSPAPDQKVTREWTARAAAHRLGLRLARKELDRLGCSVVGTEPLTIRIPGRVGEARRSFVWQTGDPILK